jgi:putative ABC transport system permease protein
MENLLAILALTRLPLPMFVFLRTVELGLKSLWLHPMRSLLTVLGIFIGVASVIWLLAIGEGISQVAQKQIEGLGALNIIVRSVKPPAELTGGMSGPIPYGLKRSEYDLLQETIPDLDGTPLPIREIQRLISYAGKDVSGRLVGCTPEYQDALQLKVRDGEFFSALHDLRQENVCVLAEQLAETLFPFEDPLGKSVYLSENKNFYRIVGVLEYRAPTAAVGGSLESQDFSNDVYIPIRTLYKELSDLIVTRRGGSFSSEIVELSQITLKVKSTDRVHDTADLVRHTLGLEPKAARKAIEKPTLKSPEEAAQVRAPRRDVAVIVPEELLEQARVTKFMFMLFMGLIAAISLLVGGIGIMNIMLATVTERTREIGIRRALGATRGHIVVQFLVETISLSVVGGLMGVVVGMLCPIVIALARQLALRFAPEVMSQLPAVVMEVNPTVSLWSLPVALACGSSVFVGVLFGIYPAFRAARMDPIEALRHE